MRKKMIFMVPLGILGMLLFIFIGARSYCTCELAAAAALRLAPDYVLQAWEFWRCAGYCSAAWRPRLPSLQLARRMDDRWQNMTPESGKNSPGHAG